jgi:flagellar biosynthetic protein FliR
MAGEYFSMLIGLNISEILDPLTQIEVPIVGQFQTLIATAVFLSIFGDHMLIQALSDSYKIVPVLDLSNLQTISILTKDLALLSGKIFMLSLKLAFPIMGTLTVLMISLALLSKSAPQMNIFMVGFPMQLTVGFLALIALAPSFGYAVSNIIRMMRSEIMILLNALKVA